MEEEEEKAGFVAATLKKHTKNRFDSSLFFSAAVFIRRIARSERRFSIHECSYRFVQSFFFFFFVADFRKSDRIFASSQTEGFNRWMYERILLMERNPIIFEVKINQLSFDFVSKFCWLDHAGKGVRNRISISPPAIQLSSRDFLSKRGLINY